jgi:hypothetical protein
VPDLSGNYGVIYDIKIRAENPTSAVRTIQLLFEPAAGPASGLFIVDGKLVGVRTVSPPDEVPIFAFRLGPGQVKDISLRTMPLGGSFYPATIIVRS